MVLLGGGKRGWREIGRAGYEKAENFWNYECYLIMNRVLMISDSIRGNDVIIMNKR